MSISSSESAETQCVSHCVHGAQLQYQTWKPVSNDSFGTQLDKSVHYFTSCVQCNASPTPYCFSRVEVGQDHQLELHQESAFNLTKAAGVQHSYNGGAVVGQPSWDTAFRIPMAGYYSNVSSFSAHSLAPLTADRSLTVGCAQPVTPLCYLGDHSADLSAKEAQTYDCRPPAVNSVSTGDAAGSRYCHVGLCTKASRPHIKKPLNAFMLFMKDKRQEVVAQCTLKESATINQILGRRWHQLSRDEQARYYEMARREKEQHGKLYPGWSARDNYAIHSSTRRRRNAHDASNKKPQKVPCPPEAPPPPPPASSTTPCPTELSRPQYPAQPCHTTYPVPHPEYPSLPVSTPSNQTLSYPCYSFPSPNCLSQFTHQTPALLSDDSRMPGRHLYPPSLANHSPITISTSITLNSTNAISNNFTVIT